VFKEGETTDSLVARLSDFGYSTCGLPQDETFQVFLPESKPWSIPPGEYHHRGFSPIDARRAMVYSFGACCLWLMFYNCADGRNDFAQDTVDVTKGTLLNLAKVHLSHISQPWTEGTSSVFLELFERTLASNPVDRFANVEDMVDYLAEHVEVLLPNDPGTERKKNVDSLKHMAVLNPFGNSEVVRVPASAKIQYDVGLLHVLDY
jgi:hypothetical protein